MYLLHLKIRPYRTSFFMDSSPSEDDWVILIPYLTLLITYIIKNKLINISNLIIGFKSFKMLIYFQVEKFLGKLNTS